MLKKALIFFGVAVVAIIIILYFSLGQIIDSVVKSAINTYGPELTQTTVHVDGVSISPFAGTGKIEGLTVGNPSGYKTPNAFTLDEVYLDVEPSTLFSNEVHVNEIQILSPHFVFESNILSSNIGTIISNVKGNANKTDQSAEKAAQTPSSDGKAAKASEPKRFVINRLLVEDGVVQIGVLGNNATVKLGRIEMSNFSPSGITGAQATAQILSLVLEKVIVAATELATNPNQTATGITDTAVGAVKNTTESVGNAISDIFGSKSKEK